MRRVLVCALTVVALGAAGCTGGTTLSTTPAPTTSADATGATPSPPPSPPPSSTEAPTPQRPAAVGDTLSLTGTGDGEALDVTVVEVVDPARSDDEFSEPDQGKKLVGVQFRLKNTGTEVYDDSPGNGARVVDRLGQQFGATIADLSSGPSFPGSVTLAAGDTALGFIAFEVPEDSKIVKVQFAMNSGFSDNVGQWSVR
ncbi:DUF4352 domain-containing protein [Streptomyces sp. NPDC058052]|uniref:DUF4352 domain-containing protein n=1 Tax=Streptomyces sp. NPDC058052 TaxID=3346316 RepID=UPI0036ED543A